MLQETNNSNRRKNQSILKLGIEDYPDKEPDRYLSDFFHVDDFTGHLTALLTSIYDSHYDYPMDQILEVLINNFHYNERECFSKNLWDYIFSIVNRELSTNGKKGEEIIKVYSVRKYYISKIIEYIKLFLRNHLLWQAQFDDAADCEQYIDGYSGYFFHDLACHELANEKTFTLRGYLRYFEQDDIGQYYVLNAFMGMEDYSGQKYSFEVDKANYRKFKKKLERVIGENISVKFHVTNIPSIHQLSSEDHTKGRILGFL